MCEVRIVPMTREDVPQVFQIEKSFFSIPWKEQDFYDLLPKEEYFFLVAKQEKKVLGYLGAAITPFDASVTTTGVLLEHQRRGVGTALFKALFFECQRRGLAEVFLEVRESNRKARAFYEKLGFCQLAIRKNFYQDPMEDGILMRYKTRVEKEC